MANSMQLSMQTPIVEGSQYKPSVSSTIPQTQEKAKVSRDFLEELKCLFLSVRNPNKSVLEELVRKIVKCELNSAEGIEWLQTAKSSFGDFRNKLVNGRVSRLVQCNDIKNAIKNF